MSLVTILITTYKRPHLLTWGLHSIARQDNPYDTEILVLNEHYCDDTEEIVLKYKDRLNIQHIITKKAEDKDKWRVPGFALNIGAKMAQGSILFITCAEIFHTNDCIKNMVTHMLENSKILCIPAGKDDLTGHYLARVRETEGNPTPKDYDDCGLLNVNIPFLMGVFKEDYINIGGYDEDFTGVGWEDTDFVERMNKYGCRHNQVDARIVHLFHPRIHGDDRSLSLTRHNQTLYAQRRGIVKRNEGREWGKLDVVS